MPERTAEEWRGVDGYLGYYEVSNLGRLRSLDRTVARGSHVMQVRGRVMTPNAGADGYPRVSLRRDGHRQKTTIHALVARAFLGPRPDRGDVRHLNGVKEDCRATNLAYGSRAANMADAVRHGSIRVGEAHHAAKVTDAQVREIRRWYAGGGVRQIDIARVYGISQTHVSDIVRQRKRA